MRSIRKCMKMGSRYLNPNKYHKFEFYLSHVFHPTLENLKTSALKVIKKMKNIIIKGTKRIVTGRSLFFSFLIRLIKKNLCDFHVTCSWREVENKADFEKLNQLNTCQKNNQHHKCVSIKSITAERPMKLQNMTDFKKQKYILIIIA